jgi:hypothetical protein
LEQDGYFYMMAIFFKEMAIFFNEMDILKSWPKKICGHFEAV